MTNCLKPTPKVRFHLLQRVAQSQHKTTDKFLVKLKGTKHISDKDSIKCTINTPQITRLKLKEPSNESRRDYYTGTQ